MKIVQINSFSNGSTGKIMMNIHEKLLDSNYDSYAIWGRGRKSSTENEVYLNDKLGVYFHALYSRFTGKTGFASVSSTKKLIKKLDEIKPDIIHLHNIHGYYINIELLFNYIRRNNIKTIWTLHDCWPFTGQCPFFTLCNCNKWKSKCNNCPMIHEYPKTFKDNSKWNYYKKKELFTGLNMIIVTPSIWLSNLVKQSFLNEYPVYVINNGINLDIFKPTSSNFKDKYNIQNKKIILGVAHVWNYRKGLKDFIELSKLINSDWVIVLIGLSKEQIKNLPDNIIGITRTENQSELAGIYSISDIYFNPTLEDNYPTTNLEAIACQTPVITYNTGGSPEIVDASHYGSVIKSLEDIIPLLNKKYEYDFDKKKLDYSYMCDKYIEIYNSFND